MKKIIPGLIIFLAGACTMIFEITGSRVLGPYLGTSIFVWTSLIGVIMAGLSLGYWFGGIISIKRSDLLLFGWIIFMAGFLILSSVIGHDYILRRILKYIPLFRFRTLAAALVLFGPASIFLGMILPYGAKLVVENILTSGASVGTLYALSTTGSILGTFAAGFLLLPCFGFANVLFSTSAILIVTAFFIFLQSKKISPSAVTILAMLILTFFVIRFDRKKGEYIDTDTRYNRVLIYKAKDELTGRPIKILMINDEKSSAMFTDRDDDLVFDVLKYYRLVEHFIPDFKSTLMIGGSGYAFPKDYLSRYPDASIDVVEIDPGLTQIAEKYFNLPDNPRLVIYHEDGRTFLNKCPKKYDAVFMDAYKSMLTIPYQLTTREAVIKISEVLNEDGVVFANIISNLDENTNLFLQAEIATYRSVFPNVLLFAVQYPEPDSGQKKIFQIFILVGLKTKETPPFVSGNDEIADYLRHLFKGGFKGDVGILTDECAPVEFYSNKAMR
ncbi:MAG: hypothetical protein FJY07_07550 [Bacteroidetes bacterium]|nr:hypothetical protein [Bacteroidota bacterium]